MHLSIHFVYFALLLSSYPITIIIVVVVFLFLVEHLAFIAHKYMNIPVPIVECRILERSAKKKKKEELFCFIGRLAFFPRIYVELNTFFFIHF